ncbi:metallophosphoesterase family protein [Elioraea rosea]|uniref:metallophosphoesterase family protein n=1 Tax=Elioraea rosea TaxID=2492390 RepID=UPI001315951F|nr:metallophosphoesterase [Elioraea rosea]
MTGRIAHLSDLHFGTVENGLDASLAEDLGEQGADAVVVTGDLTQRAQADEFTAARRFLDGLGLPVLAVPGNHDIPAHDLLARFGDPFGRWHAYFSPSTEGMIALGDTLVIGLNTVRRMAAHLDWSAGRISHEQIASIVSARTERRARRVVLALHHPPVHPDWAAHRRPLGRSRALRATLGRTGVVAILAGHLHRPLMLEQGRGLPPQIVSGSSLSHRHDGHGNSYNLVDVGASRIDVTVRQRRGMRWLAAPIRPGPADLEAVSARVGTGGAENLS